MGVIFKKIEARSSPLDSLQQHEDEKEKNEDEKNGESEEEEERRCYLQSRLECSNTETWISNMHVLVFGDVIFVDHCEIDFPRFRGQSGSYAKLNDRLSCHSARDMGEKKKVDYYEIELKKKTCRGVATERKPHNLFEVEIKSSFTG